VVKGQWMGVGEQNPRRGGGIIAPDRPAPPTDDPEGHARRGFPGVPVRTGVDANDGDGAAAQPGLLTQFAHEGLFDGLSELYETARERPEPSERRPSASDQEDSPGADPHRVHGQGRVLVPRAHGSLEAIPVLGVARYGDEQGHRTTAGAFRTLRSPDG